MVKKKSSGQNVVIVILCILLLISIGFGVTYSYYNGKTNLVTGNITTANLAIELRGEKFGQTTQFSISAPINESFLVPGNGLNNLKLNLFNQCNQETYMVVVYSLKAEKLKPKVNPETGEVVRDSNGNIIMEKENISSALTNTPAIAFQDNAFSKDEWKDITYVCENVADTSYTCLVGINPFEARNEGEEGYSINILQENKLRIPEQWSNLLQNCEVEIAIRAYAIQSKNLPAEYEMPILEAQSQNDMDAKAQAIAKATLVICGVDAVKD